MRPSSRCSSSRRALVATGRATQRGHVSAVSVQAVQQCRHEDGHARRSRGLHQRRIRGGVQGGDYQQADAVPGRRSRQGEGQCAQRFALDDLRQGGHVAHSGDSCRARGHGDGMPRAVYDGAREGVALGVGRRRGQREQSDCDQQETQRESEHEDSLPR
ncbi:MAG: hypothetical protein KatS3mg051_1281 [Anaerolineae bacterium]|nr:MAG: hypothetical protein KatS3mg051_1281 [Anaerolineae bacterium]